MMASSTPARPWTAWLGRELCGDSRPSKDQSQIARGVGLSGRRQAEHQMEAEAS
jgi:hypothetical protein